MSWDEMCARCGPKPVGQFYRPSDNRKTRYCIPCETEKARRSYHRRKQTNPAKLRRSKHSSHLKQNFRIDVNQYNEMLLKQQYRCGICCEHQSLIWERLGVDHSHSTGVIRGLLCNPCNRAIGLFCERYTTLLGAYSYLKFGRPYDAVLEAYSELSPLPKAVTKRKSYIRWKYNIGVEDWQIMFANQSGLCTICRELRRLEVDHNHQTKEVRGLLCRPCNLGLSQIKDRPILALAAVDYLNGMPNTLMERASGLGR